jgi:queuine tRNA-ribosyltransferase
MLGKQICTLHNIRFYLWLMEQAREKLKDGTFTSWKNMMVKKLTIRL